MAVPSERMAPQPLFAPIEDAVAAIARGEIVIVVDDPDRENEGDFVMAADRVTPEAVNFMITHGRGLLCLPMTDERLRDLGLRPMVAGAEDGHGTAFTVSVDLREPPGTGISAADRARCIRRAVAPDARFEEFTVPGHVFPLRARAGGVLERAGHTEAAVDLARLASRTPAGAICEIMNPDGTMARLDDLVEVAATHGLHLITIEDLIAYRMRHETVVRRVATSELPTAHGVFRTICFESDLDGGEHLALVCGRPEGRDGVLVHVHVECVIGDVFGGLACDCGARLEEALARVAAEGAGVVVYLRRPEGSGVSASHLGFPADARERGTAMQILRDLGLRNVRLLADDAITAAALSAHGIGVAGRESLVPDAVPDNLSYLSSKREEPEFVGIAAHALEHMELA